MQFDDFIYQNLCHVMVLHYWKNPYDYITMHHKHLINGPTAVH